MKYTFEKFKRDFFKLLLFEDTMKRIYEEIKDRLPILDLGNVIKLDTCPKQNEMCFGRDGFLIAHKSDNPDLDADKPYIMIIKNDGHWEMHFHNFKQEEKDSAKLNDLYNALKTLIPSGFRICARGGCTPGGLSGISKLTDYGFRKEFVDGNIYWGGGDIDMDKFNEWINKEKHFDEYVVIQGDKKISPRDFTGEKTIKNTEPKAFDMIRN